MKRVEFQDDDKYSKVVYPNGNHFCIIYKHCSEKHIVFHYKLKYVTGGMKIISNRLGEEEYSDVLGQMDSSLPYLFMPTLFNYFYSENLKRLNNLIRAVDLIDKGKTNILKKENWLAWHNIDSPKAQKETRQGLKRQTRLVAELDNMIKLYHD